MSYPRDEILLAGVARKTNGANVHDVNGILGAYNAACEFYHRKPNDVQAKKMLAHTTLILSFFADTGDIKDAKKRYPFPKNGVYD